MITLWRVCLDHIFRRSVSGVQPRALFSFIIIAESTENQRRTNEFLLIYIHLLEVILLDNRCICCGEIIPEGLQICPVCEKKIRDGPIKREGRRKSGSPYFWRWFHGFSLVAHPGRNDRRMHRHRAAGDLLSEQSQTGRKEMVGR